MSEKPAIEELERLLDKGGDQVIEILPNGEVRRTEPESTVDQKPLTFQRSLGGEYS